jgi:hypothetical protein
MAPLRPSEGFDADRVARYGTGRGAAGTRDEAPRLERCHLDRVCALRAVDFLTVNADRNWDSLFAGRPSGKPLNADIPNSRGRCAFTGIDNSGLKPVVLWPSALKFLPPYYPERVCAALAGTASAAVRRALGPLLTPAELDAVVLRWTVLPADAAALARDDVRVRLREACRGLQQRRSMLVDMECDEGVEPFRSIAADAMRARDACSGEDGLFSGGMPA